MGDRGNLFIKEGERNGSAYGVYLYTHWGGTALPEVLKGALLRGESRWDDAPYLARIIFCELLKQQESSALDGLTGLGISSEIGDNEYPVLTVDCDKQVVSMDDEKSWAFKDYVKLDFSESTWAVLQGVPDEDEIND